MGDQQQRQPQRQPQPQPQPQQPPPSDGLSVLLKWIVIVLVLVVVIVVIVLIAVFAGGSFQKTTESTTAWPGYGAAGGSAQSFTIKDAQKLSPKELKSASMSDLKGICAKHKKKLATPRTDFYMNQLKDTIKEYHKDAECDYYATGLILNPDVRYESLDGKVKWAALSSGKDPGVPKKNESRDCVSVAVADGAVEMTEPKKCGDIESFTCLLIHDETGNCFVESKAECIVSAPVEAADLLAAWEAATKAQKKAQNIVFIDQGHVLEEFKNFTTAKCSALDVKYVLEYVDVYSKATNKAVKIDAVQDPEWGCVNIDGNTLNVSRVQCDDVGCPICF